MLKSYIYLRSSVRYYAYINTYEWVCFADQLHPAIFLVFGYRNEALAHVIWN